MSVFVLVVISSVFFFKQKTAYEMRISDWSSDVCSSDLIAEGAGVDLHDEPVVEAHPRHHGQHMRAKQLGVGRADFVAGDAREQRLGFGVEIGRASCRERVCQYV